MRTRIGLLVTLVVAMAAAAALAVPVGAASGPVWAPAPGRRTSGRS